MTRLPLLFLAVVFAIFNPLAIAQNERQEAAASDKKEVSRTELTEKNRSPVTSEASQPKKPQPTILDEKTWTWKGSKDNYARYADLTFEVGIGNKRDGIGGGNAGVEIENV